MHLMTEKRYSSDMRFEKVKYEKFLKSDQFELASKGLAAWRLLCPRFARYTYGSVHVERQCWNTSPFASVLIRRT